MIKEEDVKRMRGRLTDLRSGTDGAKDVSSFLDSIGRSIIRQSGGTPTGLWNDAARTARRCAASAAHANDVQGRRHRSRGAAESVAGRARTGSRLRR